MNKASALSVLAKGKKWEIRGGVLNWFDESPQPTEKEINDKIAELQAEYDAKQYQRDRADSYPKIGEQLDMLFHAIDAGKVDKTSDFYKSLKAVKDKYPKG